MSGGPPLTRDDLHPKSEVCRIARRVAGRSGIDGLDPNWLNDAVKGFLPGADPAAAVLLDRPHLSVSVASPRYLFVLKAVAGREVDEDDLRRLWPLCGFASADEALDSIESASPRQPLRPAIQYLVESLAEELGT